MLQRSAVPWKANGAMVVIRYNCAYSYMPLRAYDSGVVGRTSLATHEHAGWQVHVAGDVRRRVARRRSIGGRPRRRGPSSEEASGRRFCQLEMPSTGRWPVADALTQD